MPLAVILDAHFGGIPKASHQVGHFGEHRGSWVGMAASYLVVHQCRLNTDKSLVTIGAAMKNERIHRIDLKMAHADHEILMMLVKKSGKSKQQLIIAAMEVAVRELALVQLVDTIAKSHGCDYRVSLPTSVEFKNADSDQENQAALDEFNQAAEVLGNAESPEAYHNRLRALIAVTRDTKWDDLKMALEYQPATEA